MAVVCGVALLAPSVALADQNFSTDMRPDRITISSKYPTVTGSAHTTFMFTIELKYELTDLDPLMGDYDTGRLQRRVFDMDLSFPDGWEVFVAESSWQVGSRISSISLAALGLEQSLVVVANAPYWENPAPGDYPISVVVSSGDLREQLDLTAKITAWYGLDVKTATERLNVKTTSGEAVELGLILTNTGQATLDKIVLSSLKPSGIANETWSVKYEPESVEDLEPGQEREVRVLITPPSKTISGDYTVTLDIAGKPALSQTPPSVDIRVSVATKFIWLAVGLLIALATVAGLVYSFTAIRQR
jgi:uncharacterized membrane protein